MEVVTAEQLSVVTGLPKTTPVAAQAAFAETDTATGAVIVGALVSRTMTV